MDLISRRKGIAPILLGSRKKNIEKEGGPKGRLFYYCTLHFTIWRSYKPLLSLLQVFELICHIRETVLCFSHRLFPKTTTKTGYVQVVLLTFKRFRFHMTPYIQQFLRP